MEIKNLDILIPVCNEYPTLISPILKTIMTTDNASYMCSEEFINKLYEKGLDKKISLDYILNENLTLANCYHRTIFVTDTNIEFLLKNLYLLYTSPNSASYSTSYIITIINSKAVGHIIKYDLETDKFKLFVNTLKEIHDHDCMHNTHLCQSFMLNDYKDDTDFMDKLSFEDIKHRNKVINEYIAANPDLPILENLLLDESNYFDKMSTEDIDEIAKKYKTIASFKNIDFSCYYSMPDTYIKMLNAIIVNNKNINDNYRNKILLKELTQFIWSSSKSVVQVCTAYKDFLSIYENFKSIIINNTSCIKYLANYSSRYYYYGDERKSHLITFKEFIKTIGIDTAEKHLISYIDEIRSSGVTAENNYSYAILFYYNFIRNNFKYDINDESRIEDYYLYIFELYVSGELYKNKSLLFENFNYNGVFNSLSYKYLRTDSYRVTISGIEYEFHNTIFTSKPNNIEQTVNQLIRVEYYPYLYDPTKNNFMILLCLFKHRLYNFIINKFSNPTEKIKNNFRDILFLDAENIQIETLLSSTASDTNESIILNILNDAFEQNYLDKISVNTESLSIPSIFSDYTYYKHSNQMTIFYNDDMQTRILNRNESMTNLMNKNNEIINKIIKDYYITNFLVRDNDTMIKHFTSEINKFDNKLPSMCDISLTQSISEAYKKFYNELVFPYINVSEDEKEELFNKFDEYQASATALNFLNGIN